MSSSHASPDRAGASEHPANRLAGETSPYLLQHAHNPVEWHPWGHEALELAKAEDRPIFLSIGYSACHWCHVMERESFENPDIARIMNAHFVNIKVDREERPDLDQIYMNAVQAMTGQGGWPMSVFLTPEGEPFFGGTYFPPSDSRGMPGFPRVLLSVHRAWAERRGEIRQSAVEMTSHLRNAADAGRGKGEASPLSTALLDHAAKALIRNFDARHGGFGQAPKFPHPMDLRVLLRQFARTGDAQALHAATFTLGKMARGGIYDHLGGGFARYSTDERWLAPHFEKMLYDNALLASAYVEAFQATGEASFARTARATLGYVLDRMTDPDGPFYSTEDADSEGEEGKYYVWSLGEILEVLGVDLGRNFALTYDVSPAGNWERKNILNLPRPIAESAKDLGRDADELEAELAESRATLLAVRGRRIAPGKDTKVLVAWNGLAIAALAQAGRALAEPRFLETAEKAAAFLLDRLRTSDGRLLHTYKDGIAKLNGYLDDYACLIDGLTRLFEATGGPRWLASAVELADVMVAEFRDAGHGGFYYTGASHETLLTRQKDLFDDATPSGNGMAATALVRLAALTGREDLATIGRQAVEAAAKILEGAPSAGGQTLIALDFLLAPPRELAIVAGSDRREFAAALDAAFARFLPHAVVAPAPAEDREALAKLVPLLEARPAVDDHVTLYDCENFTCRAPVAGTSGVLAALAGAGRG
ncbi:thioredoxin domain-containing protein [Paludisphaera mucosa]|uniref:Thioredoxin domain-containing protein n=1 Tax=Paludisphaera mucosa TaxID=3030827 RepID=A0ABT6FCM3_9BACT|nr:thioredoxin domain-containing protein [Paludisphaera mucosa]MDG3005282.1 thioredoxin domain-containing protein [Paludisphaera mucosa]